MGNCASNPTKNVKKHSSNNSTNQQQVILNRRNQDEVYCLKLIYKDLIQRCQQKAINQKTFQQFFHMSHVIGGALFRIFSNNNASKEISEEMFIQSVLKFSKSNVNQKMKLLFSIYDLNQNHGIDFNQFLAMLLSFPQQQIKQILSKDQFLESLPTDQISYYLIASKKSTNEQLNKQYKSTLSLFPHVPLRKKSTSYDCDPYCTNNLFTLKLQPNKPEKKKAQQQISTIRPNAQRQFIKEQLKKKIDKSVFTTQIFRKYTQYIFKKYKLDKQSNQMNFQIFTSLFHQHPRLYQQFFEGFHSYLWMHQNGNPIYKKKPPRIWGFCTQKSHNEKKKVFLITIRNSLLTFQNQQMEKPLSIRNLQGLIVYQIQDQQGYGFGLKHQSGFYNQHKFYFQNKQTQTNWLIQLNQFLQQNVFKKYKLLQRIGKGNFSSVYKCQNKQNGQKRAIKIIQKANVTQQQIAAVHYQSQVLATCAMPDVLRAYERFQTNTHIYLVTQLIEGPTLHQYVKQKNQNRLSQSETKFIMRKLLTAVKQFHDIGIIHRDLKLQNILMKLQDGKYTPKIIDFGLAIFKINLKNLDDNSKYGGTPNYIPPQIFYQSQYDQTIDVFSLGVIMHYMLTGFLPFHGNSINVIRELTTSCFINYQTKRWENISENAKNLLSRMLCYKQYRSSAAEVLEHEWFKVPSHNPQT